MMRLSCFEVFEMVADSIGEDFLSKHKLNKDKEALLRRECEAFDAVAAETDNIGFTIIISEDTGEISISLDFMYDLSIVTKSVPFLDIIQDNTKSMIINRADEDDVLKLTFVFDSIWD